MNFVKHEVEAIEVAKSTLLHRLYPKLSTGCLNDDQVFEAVMQFLCMETELEENHPDRVDDCAHEVCNYLDAFQPNNNA
tara:strand:- start:1077 stop:1313 length:237 start_codon:yes stop_codon:yes gene_type:complete